MTDNERVNYEAGIRGAEFNTANEIELASIGELTPIIVSIKDTLSEISVAEGKQQHDKGDVSGSKDDLKKIMAETVVRYASRGTVKAKHAGKPTLASALDHPVTYIFQADGVLAFTRTRDLCNLMKDNLGVLSNISDTNIAEIDAAANAFEKIMNEPVSIIKEKKALGTDLIHPLIITLTDLMDDETKLLHSYFDVENPKLVAEWTLKTQLLHTGKRHNIVSIHLIEEETGNAIINGHALCEKNNKIGDVSEDGIYRIEGVPTGKQLFKITAFGRIDVEIGIQVQRGANTEVTVKMKKV